MDSNAKQLYQPLQGDEFRLLYLRPGGYEESVCCSIRPWPLKGQEAPKYEALSYTWGVSSEQRSIVLEDGIDFPITNNLWYALKRLRQQSQTRIIWVDAVCINQDDVTERGQQVAMMYQIYSSANCGIVWLGESDSSQPLPTAVDEANMTADTDKSHLGYLEQCRAFDAALVANQPWWFHRVWTIQEAAASSDLIVYFGPYQMTWKDFSDSFITNTAGYFHMDQSELQSLRGAENCLSANERLAVSLKFLEYDLFRNKDIKLLSNVAALTMTAQATDPRDHVLGLLGLIPADTASVIPCDYTKSASEIFALATYGAILTEFSMAIWQCVYPEASDSVPSWAVDFAASDHGSGEPMAQSIRGTQFFHSITLKQDRQTISLSADTKTLTIRGRILDRVDMIQPFSIDPKHWKPSQVPMPLLVGLWIAWKSSPVLALSQERFDENIQRRPPADAMKIVTDGYTQGTDLDDLLGQMFRLWEDTVHLPPVLKNTGSSTELIWSYIMLQTKDFHVLSTAAGFLGYALNTVAINDMVVLIKSSGLPVILRPKGDAWTFQGFVYIHGVVRTVKEPNLKYFEVFDDWFSRTDLEDQEIMLV